jgi:phosphatidylinositol alpha-1,6-mannosyltransferase
VFPPRVGGTGRLFHGIYGRLAPQGYVIAAGEAPGQVAFDRTHSLRVRRIPLAIHYRGIRGPRSFREYNHAFRELRSIVKEEHVSTTHCARCLPEGLLGLGLRLSTGIPFACYAHGEELTSASLSREQTLWARLVLSRASLMFASSHHSAGLLGAEWGVPEQRIRVVHPGVDTAQFVPAPPDPDFRRRMAWEGRQVVLTVGRLQKRKGHDQMIRALAQVRRRLPNLLYAILGDGEERAGLTRLVGELGLEGHVQFLGELDDQAMIRCYQQCQVFALPNREINRDIEGFGIVLLEAQACGKPVIAGASGGTAETMQVDRTGYLVPCDRPDQLADLVWQLLSSPERRDEMGQVARKWVVENFDWSVAARRANEAFSVV